MFDTTSILVLGALLFLKHFVADGPLQSSWHVQNKGVFLHPAGLAHSGIHVAGSALAFALWPFVMGLGAPTLQAPWLTDFLWLAAAILVAEFVVHYFVDLGKCKIDRILKCSSVQINDKGDPEVVIHNVTYFYFFLLDQTCHSLTYLAMLYVLASGAPA